MTVAKIENVVALAKMLLDSNSACDANDDIVEAVCEALVTHDTEVRKLREERDLASNAQEAAELRIVELREELFDATHAVDTGGVAVYRITGPDQLFREPVDELLREFTARGAKLARVESLLGWAGPLPIAVLREALRDEPKTVEAER